jgi:hypothetical protein
MANATVVDDTIRFVSCRSKEKAESTGSSNEDDKESNFVVAKQKLLSGRSSQK